MLLKTTVLFLAALPLALPGSPAFAGPPSAPQIGECPSPSEENIWAAGRKIARLLEAEKYAWHRGQLGLEGAVPSEAVLVTDDAVCAQTNATGPMVRDGVVVYLPYRVRGVTLVVYSKPFGSGASSAHPPPGPVTIENGVLW